MSCDARWFDAAGGLSGRTEVRDVNAVFTTRHRRRAMRVVVFAALVAILAFAPGAMALETLADAVAVTTDTTAVDPAPGPVAPAPVVAEPDVAPSAEPPPPPPPDPVAIVEPVPVAAVQPAPDPPPSAVTEPTPAAPQEVILVVQDAPAVVLGAEPVTGTLTGSDSGLVATVGDQLNPGALATPLIVGTSSQTPPADPSKITPLVAPIVQTLGSGLLSPYVRSETFGTQFAVGGAVVSHVAAAPLPLPVHPPAQATRVAAESPFGFALPHGGWTGQGAGVLALLMGFLPLGLPDGKSSLTQETQTALMLMGALLIVLPFFASLIRDRRRRGPRGFATLALRPG